ncbi:MAG: hypothetical protein ACREOU_00955 [Candidatus Eiseniibacteriota bacterium]
MTRIHSALRHPQAWRRSVVLVTIGFGLASFGCGEDEPTGPSEGRDDTPVNSSPQGALGRMAWALENEDDVAYADLFTRDFTFRFSADTDPSLVLQYGLAFRRGSEIAFARHLFDGFTNVNGDSLGGSVAMSVDLNQVIMMDDPEYPDSTAHYRFASAPAVVAAIQVPRSSQVVTVNLTGRQDFFLVRGDAAALTAGQEARSDRWYVRGWDDRSLAVAKRGGRDGRGSLVEPFSTWGRLKHEYLR